MKHDDRVRAALNICAREDVSKKLDEIGLKVIVISGKVEDEGCPVTHFIEKNVELMDAYVHLGDFGIEPTTTIIGRDPEILVDIIRKLV
jgi:predicted fused transcriptional regulator/phosphomethylpyrimidine kinase